MDAFQFLFDAPVRHVLSAAIGLFGLGVFWRGLFGGRHGERGLVRRGVATLDRLYGWRLTLVGLTLVGLGAAWFWEERWLIFLTLGIAYVELQEATQVIRAWRWSETSKRKPAPTGRSV